MQEELLNEAVSVAGKAGEAILEIYSTGDFGTTFKEGGSPLTFADEAANKAITEGLARITPGLPILSEESRAEPYEVRKGWKRFWLVDPLDGTKEFIKRNGEFTVNIALIEDGRPVLGVVFAPVPGITYFASLKNGAFKTLKGGTEPISAAGYSGGPLKIVGSRSHAGPELERFLSKIDGAEFVSMGSSLKLCIVAEGKADLYPRLGPTMEWDTAAADCVVEAAGGAVTDLKGERLRYNKEELLNPFFMVAGSPPFPWQGLID